MSRRESMKKALGITVYPWSSDEDSMNADDSAETEAPVQMDENNQDSANRAGSSSGAPPPTPAAASIRNRLRLERDLYWSMLNHPKPFDPTPSISAYEPPETQRVDLNCPVSSMHRVVAIKRISRLNRLRRGERIYDESAIAAAEIFRISQRSRRLMEAANRRQRLAARSQRQDSQREDSQPSSPNQPDEDTAQVNTSVAADGLEGSADAQEESFSPHPEDNNSDDNENPEDDPMINGVTVDETDETDPEDDGSEDTANNPDAEQINIPDEVEENIEDSDSPEDSPDDVQRRRHKRKRENLPDDINEALDLKEFNMKLLRLLECPVCLEWMEPPLSQCGRGHLVCVRCRARLHACPLCRTPFSSVRNRAMEAVAELVRYPCRHGCGREKRLRRRAAHEANCPARLYRCPAAPCLDRAAMPLADLPHHFQSRHPLLVKRGPWHKLAVRLNEEQHENYVVMVAQQMFHLRLDVELRRGLIVYVAFIGPVARARSYTYEVTVQGQYSERKLVYSRATHSDLECSSLNVRRKDCFHLPMEQALNYLRGKYRVSDPNSTPLDLILEINSHACSPRENEEPDT